MHVPAIDHRDATMAQQLMADRLVDGGWIQSARVERAFRTIPRHSFLLGLPLAEAYDLRSIPTKRLAGRTVSSSSAPPIMADMLEQLDLHPGQRVLEIGTGTGYNAALLTHLVGPDGRVVTIDFDQDIVDLARQRLAEVGISGVQVLCGDGALGAKHAAPFDRIIVTAAATEVSTHWMQQLSQDGRLVAPVQLGGILTQKLLTFRRDGDHLVSDGVGDCVFLPMRGEQADEARPDVRPMKGVRVLLGSGSPIRADRLGVALRDMPREWTTGLSVRSDEVRSSLLFWLGLHEPQLTRLTIDGDRVGDGHLPWLTPYPSSLRSRITVGIADEHGIALLTRPDDGAGSTSSVTGTPSFELHIRVFGDAPLALMRLYEGVMAWRTAGRPSTEGLRVRVFPCDNPAPRAVALPSRLVKKRTSTMLLDWPTSQATSGMVAMERQ